MLPWLDDLLRDVRHGLRALRRAPAFASVAITRATGAVFVGVGVTLAVSRVRKEFRQMKRNRHAPAAAQL
jgi:hypothetical protein